MKAQFEELKINYVNIEFEKVELKQLLEAKNKKEMKD